METIIKVIKEINPETGQELTEFYILTDVLLSADVFPNYVNALKTPMVWVLYVF